MPYRYVFYTVGVALLGCQFVPEVGVAQEPTVKTRTLTDEQVGSDGFVRACDAQGNCSRVLLYQGSREGGGMIGSRGWLVPAKADDGVGGTLRLEPEDVEAISPENPLGTTGGGYGGGPRGWEDTDARDMIGTPGHERGY